MVTEATNSVGYNGWKNENNVEISSLNCGDNRILRASKEISKTITLSKAYYFFLVSVDAYILDSWDGETFSLSIND